MASDPKADAALALHRFGVSPRPGSIAAIASDPRGALLADLDRAGAGRIPDADLLPSGPAWRAAFAYQEAQREARRAERAMQQANAQGAGGSSPDMKPADQPSAPAAPRPNPGPGVPQQIYLDEAKARFDAALGAEIGFVERLVWFWSNHFCVSADKGNVRQICGAYEREAIRAHVLGRFGDMLLAVESHPAMLIYLDNARSIGPELARRPAAEARPQRKSRPRDPRAAYARRAQRLHPGGRHPVRQCDHGLDPGGHAPGSGARRRVRVQCAHAPAGRADGDRQELSRHRGGAGPCRARRARASSRHREARRHQARAPFRRRRAAARAGGAAGQALSGDARRSERGGEDTGDRAGSLGGAARQAQASRRMDHRGVARRRCSRLPTSGRSCRRTICWANRCGGRRLPKASPTRARHGSTASRSASTLPTSWRGAWAERPIRERCSRNRWRRSPRPRRARPSRAPRAARRRSRSCSWRRNSNADDVP